MTINSTPSIAAKSNASIAERTAEAALAKATARLAADKKAGAAADVLKSDQDALVKATKASQKTDDPHNGSSKVSVTA